MHFPPRDLTNQYISTSYQDVVQRYNYNPIVYFLDGYGYTLLGVPTSSIGGIVLTQDQTASWAVNALTSAFSTSASYALISTLASVADVALLADTASIAFQSDTASFAYNAVTSSFTISASWAPTPHVERGLISGSLFTGLPKEYNISFANAFFSNIYTVVIIGENARAWSYSNRTNTNVTINSNSNKSLTGMVSYRIEEI